MYKITRMWQNWILLNVKNPSKSKAYDTIKELLNENFTIIKTNIGARI